jgi:hypothetical protein
VANPDLLNLLGLVLNMIGALFLSVEAIKVHNLKAIQQRFLSPLHQAIVPPTVHVAEGPLPTLPWRDRLRTASYLSFYFTMPLVAGALSLWILNSLLGGLLLRLASVASTWVVGTPWFFTIPLMLWAGGLLMLLLFLMGEVVHVALVRGTKLLINAVDFIERHTATGVIGIIGFIFMLLGYAAQLYASYSSL